MHAVDALETALSVYVDDRRDIPKPSGGKRGFKTVTLPVLTEAKLALYTAMRANKIGKAELARRLNCHLPQVDRLLDLITVPDWINWKPHSTFLASGWISTFPRQPNYTSETKR